MKKALIFLLLLCVFVLSCEDDSGLKKSEDPNKDASDLKYLKVEYMLNLRTYHTDNLDTPTDDFLMDTSRIILKWDLSGYSGTNLTKTENIQGSNKTRITFHKAFYDNATKLGLTEDVKLQSVARVMINSSYECAGPMREFKTDSDVKAFLLLLDQTKWTCNGCCPITVTGSNQADPVCVQKDYRSYWYKDLAEYPNFANYLGIRSPKYDFSELLKLYGRDGIPSCN